MKKNKLVTGLALSMMIAPMILGVGYSVDAAMVNVDPESTEITAKNNFIIPSNPDVSKVKTKVTVKSATGKQSIIKPSAERNGNSWEDEPVLDNFMNKGMYVKSLKNTKYNQQAVHISDLKSTDTISVDFGALGVYKGKPANLKMEISDIIKSTADNSTMTVTQRKTLDAKGGVNETGNGVGFKFSDSPFDGMIYQNVAGFSFELVMEQDGKAINFDGDTYIGINSLNGKVWDSEEPVTTRGATEGTSTGAEGVWYEKMKEDPYYVTKDTSLIERPNPFDSSQTIVSGRPNNHVLSHEFNKNDRLGAEKFNMGTVSFQIKGTNPKFKVVNESASAWTSLSSATLFNVVPDKPEKDVIDESGESINKDKVKPGDKLTYEVSQKVGTLGVDLLAKYKVMNFVDPLPEQVDYLGAKLVDEKGNEIKDAGDLTYDEKSHTVTFVSNKDFLENKVAYAGETYSLLIDTQVKMGIDENEEIVNQGHTIVNKNEGETNIVENPPEIIKGDIVKHVIGKDGKESDLASFDIGDEVTFKGDVTVDNNKLWVGIRDQFSKFIDISKDKYKVVEKDSGKDVTKEFDVKVNEKTELIEFLAKDPVSFAGKKLEVYVSGTIKDADFTEVVDEDGNIMIPNIIESIYEDGTDPSNKVHATVTQHKPKVIQQTGGDNKTGQAVALSTLSALAIGVGGIVAFFKRKGVTEND